MAMTLLDSVAIDHPGAIARNFNLYVGDVADMTGHNVDVLAVSCLPGDYTPSPGSVLGALAARGVSVQAMSGNKAANYEPDLPCWISNPVSNPQPGIAFSRVLVYEPASPATNSVNLVSAIFTALSAFRGSAQTSVAMPLVSTGSAGADPSLIMRALFFAAVSWGSRAAFPLSTINLVLYQGNPQLNAQLQALFADLKNRYQHVDTIPPSNYVSQAKSIADKGGFPSYLTYRQVWGIALYTTNYAYTVNPVLRASNITNADYQALMPVFEWIDSGLANIPSLGRTSQPRPRLLRRRLPGIPGREYPSASGLHELFIGSRLSRRHAHSHHEWHGKADQRVFGIPQRAGSPVRPQHAGPRHAGELERQPQRRRVLHAATGPALGCIVR